MKIPLQVCICEKNWIRETKMGTYLVLLRGESRCCRDLFKLCRCLLPEDSLQQHKYVCRLWRGLQEHCETSIPKKAVGFLVNGVEIPYFWFLHTWTHNSLRIHTRQRVTGSGRTSSPEVKANGRPQHSQGQKPRCHLAGSTESPPSLILAIRNLITRG